MSGYLGLGNLMVSSRGISYGFKTAFLPVDYASGNIKNVSVPNRFQVKSNLAATPAGAAKTINWRLFVFRQKVPIRGDTFMGDSKVSKRQPIGDIFRLGSNIKKKEVLSGVYELLEFYNRYGRRVTYGVISVVGVV